MTLCVVTKGHCLCQPDEGVFCPDYKPDAYVQSLMDAITELRADGEAWKAALYLLEVCRGSCDLWSDAWPAYGEGNEVFGVKIGPNTAVAEVVDAFLALQLPQLQQSTEEK